MTTDDAELLMPVQLRLYLMFLNRSCISQFSNSSRYTPSFHIIQGIQHSRLFILAHFAHCIGNLPTQHGGHKRFGHQSFYPYHGGFQLVQIQDSTFITLVIFHPWFRQLVSSSRPSFSYLCGSFHIKPCSTAPHQQHSVLPGKQLIHQGKHSSLLLSHSVLPVSKLIHQNKHSSLLVSRILLLQCPKHQVTFNFGDSSVLIALSFLSSCALKTIRHDIVLFPSHLRGQCLAKYDKMSALPLLDNSLWYSTPFVLVVVDGSFILFQHFHNPSLGDSEEAFWAFYVGSTQRYVSFKLGVCWQLGSLVRSIVSSFCVGRQQQGLPSSRLVQIVFSFGKLCNTHTFHVVLLCGCSHWSYNLPALIRRVPTKQPLSRSTAVSFGVNTSFKTSSLTRCATHINLMACHPVEVQTVAPSNDGLQSEGAYQAVSFWICGRLFRVCSLFNRRKFCSYLPPWPSLVIFVPKPLLSFLVRVRYKTGKLG